MIHTFSQKGYHIALDVNSGAVHIVDELVLRLLEHLEPPLPDRLPAAARQALGGFFSPAQLEEGYAEILELVHDGQLFAPDNDGLLADHMTPSPVKAMCLNVSHDCNLRCSYCFAGKGDYNQGRMLMSAQTGRLAVDFLLAHSQDRENLEVDFFGGEPLLNFAVVREVVGYARDKEAETGKRFRFTITTNGLLLDEEKTGYINREMHNVVLSLDGRRQVHDRVRARVDGSGCYDAVVPKIRRLVAARGDKDYYVRGTFTKYNKDFAQDVFALHELGFDQISIEPVVAKPDEPYALTQEDLPELFAEYERLADRLFDAAKQGRRPNFFHFLIDLEQGPCAVKRLRGCGCGNEYIAVTPEGDLYPCHQFIGHAQWRMGNLYDGSFDRDRKAFFARTTIFDKPDCRACWAKFYCSGGCNANNMQYEGDVLKAHTLSCELEKKRLECAIVLMARRLCEGEGELGHASH